MRSRKMALVLTALALVPAIASEVGARSRYVAQIPNGSVFGCANCHADGGSGPRNNFGLAFRDAGAWGAALAALDSDGDGWTNGSELRDPSGTWQVGQPDPGSPTQVGNPGSTGSTPVAVEALTWGAIKSLYRGR